MEGNTESDTYAVICFFFLFLVAVSEMCTNGERNTTENCYCFEERFTLYLCFRYLIMQ